MLHQIIGLSVTYIPVCASTNSYMRENSSAFASGDCIYAGAQTAGRGQKGNSWHAGSGLNIAASIKLLPQRLPSTTPFVLSMFTSLALVKMLQDWKLPALIKWPNDILIQHKKIAGILIENTSTEKYITESIIGIGLNVNEIHFPTFPLPATSLKIETGMDHEINRVLETMLQYMDRAYKKWLIAGTAALEEEYLSQVYGFGQFVEIQKDGINMHVKITGIDSWGRLKTENPDGLSGLYDIKEIKFIF